MDRRSFLKGLVRASVAGAASSRAGATAADNTYINYGLRFSITKPSHWIYFHPTDFEILVMKNNGAFEDTAKFDWHQECVGTPALVVSSQPETLINEAAICSVLFDDPQAYDDHGDFISKGALSSVLPSILGSDVEMLDDGLYTIKGMRQPGWSFSANVTLDDDGVPARFQVRYVMCLNSKADLTFVFARPVECAKSTTTELEQIIDSVRVF